MMCPLLTVGKMTLGVGDGKGGYQAEQCRKDKCAWWCVDDAPWTAVKERGCALWFIATSIHQKNFGGYE